MRFVKGDRVKHPARPEWGVGQILEDSDGVNALVFFVGTGEKKLRLQQANLMKVEGAEAEHPALDSRRNLKKGKSASKVKATKYIELPLMIESFLRRFPGGFHDKDYLNDERDYKVAAHHEMLNELNEPSFAGLLGDSDYSGDYSEICRLALKVVNSTNLIFKREIISFADGLKREPERFSQSLYALLYGEGEFENRFSAFTNTLSDIDAAKWTIATYFQFLAFPDRHMFLKPTVTLRMAGARGFELNYRPEPNWLTYSKLLDFSRLLFNDLAELSPEDMIDVQSFIWCVPKIEEGEYD
jgi:hypothetical protein